MRDVVTEVEAMRALCNEAEEIYERLNGLVYREDSLPDCIKDVFDSFEEAVVRWSNERARHRRTSQNFLKMKEKE